jgi:acyl-homoserine-lactone acylase
VEILLQVCRARLRNITALLIVKIFVVWQPLAASEISWDRWGIPHITGASDAEAHYALGWAQMQAHGDLLVRLYARARGTAASIGGENYLPSDTLTWQLDIPQRAGEWLQALPRNDRARLTAFVAGLNAYAKKHPQSVASPWREVLPILDTDPLAHLYQVVHRAFIADGTLQGLPPATEGGPGSNAYVIAPSRSASKNAMLVANPHLPWGDLFTWFECQLEFDTTRVYGAALVGTPFVGIGFSEYGGWTHTVNHYDGADLYELKLSADGYLLDGKQVAFKKRTHNLQVRDADGRLASRSLEILHSAHGPVIEQRGGKGYAIRIAAWESYGMLRQYWDMAAARDVNEFESAVKGLQMPFFNFFYASRKGDIYYFHGGHNPRRTTGDWNFWADIVPGDRSDLIWQDYLPYSAMPHFRNPPAGFIQNANEPPWTTTWPSVLKATDFDPTIAPAEELGFRSQHALSAVLADSSITFDELVAMKQSTQLTFAERILEPLLKAAAGSTDPLIKQAHDVLRNWDKRTDADSRGALLFLAWSERMHDSDSPIFATQWSAAQPVTTPSGLAHPQAALGHLRAAAQTVLQRFGALDAPYGQGVRIRRGTYDLPGSGGPSREGSYRKASGSLDDQGVEVLNEGDSFVAVIEFGPRVRAVGLLPYGNWSRTDSSHNGDQLPLFSRGELRPVWFYAEDIKQQEVRREVVSYKN